MTEKDRIINEFVDALVNGDQYTAEELLIKAFDAGYDMGYQDGLANGTDAPGVF